MWIHVEVSQLENERKKKRGGEMKFVHHFQYLQKIMFIQDDLHLLIHKRQSPILQMK